MNTPNRDRRDTHSRPTGSLSAASTAVLFCLASAPSLAVSAERDLDAHEHGAATLDIAVDGARLYLDLESPADNVLGFEHAPSTEAEHAAVAEADRVLGAAGVFEPDAAAGCTLEETSNDFSFPVAEDGNDGHDDEHADADGHDDEHADADGHDDEHAGDAKTTHADVTVSQVFLCESPEALRTLETTLFERFDGFREIAVQLVGPGGQDGARLTADRPVVPLASIL